MMTVLEEAIRLTDQACQPYTVITSDQQLYSILVDISGLIPRNIQAL